MALWPLMVLLGSGCQGDDDQDSTAPEIKFTYPNEFTILNVLETIRVLARDNDGINNVVFVAQGDTLLITATAPYSLILNTSAYPDCTTADSYLELMATAEDLAGNTSSTSRKFYTFNRPFPPVPVKLHPPAQIGKHSAELSWEQSVDYNFSRYVLYRDTVNTVSAASDSLVSIGDPDSTDFKDPGTGVSPFGLLEDSDYYYRVWVYDIYGKGTGSDSAALVHTLLPQPSKLLTLPPVTKYTVELQWPASAEDVLYYRLHRGQFDSTALADTNFVPPLDSIAAITPDLITYLDTDLTADTTYFYYLYVIDSAGYTHLFERNDMVAARTMNIPAAVLNDPPLSVTKYSTVMSWEEIAEQEDPSRIILYRAEAGAVDTNDVIVYDQPNGTDLSLTDNQLQQGRLYSYRLLHRDSRDNRAWSNTVTITTFAITDMQDAGLGVQVQEKHELTMGWTAYNYPYEDDFAGYILIRNDQTVFTSLDANENTFIDDGLDRSTPYQYVLSLSDTSGASRSFNIIGTTRDIYPADIMAITTTEAWQFELEWSPSPEPASEFVSYQLLRSNDPDELFDDSNGDNEADCLAGGNCEQVASFYQQEPTAPDSVHFYSDGDPNLIRLRAYYYVVLTYDQYREYAAGAIKGDTLLTNPDPVELSIVVEGQTINLSWTKANWYSDEADAAGFHSYEVWRNTEGDGIPGDDNSYQRLAILADDIASTTYPDGISEEYQGVDFWYSIVLRDNFGQTAASNEEEASTPP
ncbi:MAG: hypothetical protein IIB43_09450 [Candidatus Marinimicrobia bacterium]|nr:hypothetical protein [Candidatus Neomarinimicrobiota bacterium]